MAPDPNHRHASDERTTATLVDLYLTEPESPDGEEALAIIHYRGGAEEFLHGAGLARSESELERIAGADILAQLGWGVRTYVEESVPILLELLGDPVDAVVSAAAIALSHRGDPRSIEPLIGLSNHPNPAVRYGVVLALGAQEEPTAVSGLVALTHDVDRDVRNWATFGIAQLTELDTPEIRDALFLRTEDEDAEVRGEALIGLSMRADPRALALVRREISGEFRGSWVVEAAGLLAHPSLQPLLESLYDRLDPEDQERFAGAFAEAIESCGEGN